VSTVSRSRAYFVAASLVITGIVALWWGLRAPAHPTPRAPTAISGGVTLYHSPGTRISFFGMEHLHAFNIDKYDRIAADLVDSGLVPEGAFGVAPAATDIDLAQIHDAKYLNSLYDTKNLSLAIEVDVPKVFQPFVNRRVLEPFRRATGATVAATRDALRMGVSITLGGGYHHARPEMGHGFCLYGDIALAIHVARQEGFSGSVLIVDTDAHQGDGNHVFFAEDPSVFSFSMHGSALFPNPKVQGDLDVALPGGIQDEEFLTILDTELKALIDAHQPSLVIHVAGADILHDDPLANFGLTVEGLVQRDRLVARTARASGAAYVHTLAGGYGPSAVRAQSQSIQAILTDLGVVPVGRDLKQGG